MKQSLVQPEFVAKISPDNSTDTLSGFYHTGISNLKEAIQVFKINEVVFCSSDIESQTIIKTMSILEYINIEFKIAPPNSSFIIGSNSINTTGDIYFAMELNSINTVANKRNKRTFDVSCALLFILCSPILILFIKNKKEFISNVLAVLFGLKTWVGINPVASKKASFGNVKTGVIYPDTVIQEKDSEIILNANLLYARNYSLVNDIKIIWSHFGQF